MKSIGYTLAIAAWFAFSPAKAEESPLAKQMEIMATSFKAINKEADSAKGAALAREAQQATIASLALLPDLVTKMPDGPEKTKASASYRTMMAKLLTTFCQIEEAFLAGDPTQVAQQCAELKTLRKAGHDRFMEEEE